MQNSPLLLKEFNQNLPESLQMPPENDTKMLGVNIVVVYNSTFIYQFGDHKLQGIAQVMPKDTRNPVKPLFTLIYALEINV